MFTRDAAARIREAQIVTVPDNLKLELPKDFQKPEGVEFTFNPQAPEWQDFKAYVVKNRLTQDEASGLLALYAGKEIRDRQNFQTNLGKEREALGAAASARVDAVTTFLRGHLGEEFAAPLLSMLVTKKGVEAFERLASKFTTQGAGSFNTTGKEPPSSPNKVSDAEWEKMSTADRLNYARQFDQSQFADKK